MTVLSPWRTGIITGSRLPKILGLSPHGTRESVLREMVREHFGDEAEFTGNIATDWGHAHEPDAIAAYQASTGQTVYAAAGEQELVMHPDLPMFGVTPDGLIGWDGMVEVKAPYRALYSHIDQRPDHYAQIQLQTACTGRAWCDYVVWAREGGIYPPCRVYHDPDWLPSVLGELAEFLAEFRETIGNAEMAAPHRAPLVDQRADAAWLDAAGDYLEALMLVKAADAALELAKADLVELAHEQRSTRGGGVLVTRSAPKGSVAYKEAVDKLLPEADLESFRKPPGKPTWTVRKAAA